MFKIRLLSMSQQKPNLKKEAKFQNSSQKIRRSWTKQKERLVQNVIIKILIDWLFGTRSDTWPFFHD